MKKLLLTLFCVLSLVAHAANQPQNPYVLIMSSSSLSESWLFHLTAQLEARIHEDFPQLTIYKEELAIPLINEEAEAVILRNRLKNKYSTPPQLIYLIGDPGYITCQPLFDKEWKETPTIVFHSSQTLPISTDVLFEKEALNDSNSIAAETYYKNRYLVRIETPFFVKETIETMQEVIPQMNRLQLVTDHRFVSAELRKQTDEIMKKHFPDIALVHLRSNKMHTEDLLYNISQGDKRTGVLYFSWFSTLYKENQYMKDKIQKVICTFSTTPVFNLREWDNKDNYCVGGHYTSLDDNIEISFHYIQRMLKGERFTGLTVSNLDQAKTYLSYSNLMWYKTDPSLFPKKDVVYTEVPPTFYEKHSLTIWVASILLILLLILYTNFRIRSIRHKNQSLLFAKRKREEEEKHRLELEELTRKYRLIIQAVNLVTWTMDTTSGLISYEKNFYRENKLNTIYYKDNLQVILPEDQERVNSSLQKLINGKSDLYHEQYRVISKNSNECQWEESFAIVNRRDPITKKTVTIVGASLNIDERKIMEERLILAKEKAEESDRLKSAFLANMSHEIRTPLNAIVGFSSILANTEDVNERNEYSHIIQNNNELLLQLINDILDLAKIEAGTLDFSFSEVNVNEILQQLKQEFALKIDATEIELKIEDYPKNGLIISERNRLTQILSNFLSNALKFTKQGSISIGCKEEENDTLYFYVTDTGCGIPKDKQPFIFDRFVKVNSFSQGTGLGLSICKTIINRLQGDIGIISEEGKGSTFWFKIPRFLQENPKEITRENKYPKKKKPLILIAEDNEENYQLFENILKEEYELIRAWDGQEAVDLFRKHSPNLVLMDIMMPVLNGYEATAEIRKVSYLVPIIAVSAYASEQTIHNFSDYEPKPINADSLKCKISNLLKK